MCLWSLTRLHKIGLANQDKVQTGRQIGQVTVTPTHNSEQGRRDGWQGEGKATGKGAGREGAGLPPRTRVEGAEDDWTEGPKGRGYGEWRRAVGWEPNAS